MLSPTKRSFRQVTSARPSTGFTLLEIVTVMAILAILATFSMGILMNGKAKALEERARSDLQLIQRGLEAYKARFGDYPIIPDSYSSLGVVDSPEAYLLNALLGNIGPTHQPINGIPSMLNTSVLQFDKVELPLVDAESPVDSLKNNWIVDPWGSAYVYDYRPKDAGWLIYGYKLRSVGEDATADTEDDIEAE